MRSRLSVLSVLAVVVGCGDNTAQTDAGVGSDAMHDAMLDAPLMGEIGVSTSNGSPSTAPSFGVAKTGVASQMTLTLTNDANGPTGTIMVALTGDAELTLDLAASTCDGVNLGAGESCTIVVVFLSSADGAFGGSLSVTSDLGTFTLPITAMSGSSDVMLSPLTPALGHIEIGVPAAVFTLMNIGAVDAAIGTIDVSGTGLTYDSTTCGSTLAPSASCTFSFRTTARGDLSGTASAIVDGETLSTTFTARGAYRVTIVPTAGTGTGRVSTYVGSSDPSFYPTPLADCPSVCSVLASTALAFTLTPDAGSVRPVRGELNYIGAFNTWMEPAPTGPTTVNIPFRALSSNVRFFGGPIDLGLRPVNVTHITTLELQNTGTSTVPIAAPEPVSSPFTLGPSTCGATLAPGATCFIQLSVQPAGANPFSTDVTVNTVEGGQAYAAQIRVFGTPARTINVGRNGTGTGKVTSTAGIDCPGTCSALVSAATDVTLNAVPDAGMTFVSWTGCPSPAGSTCTIGPSTTTQNVTARFDVSGTSQVAVTQVGTGFGQVRITNGSNTTTCQGSCALEVTPGTSVTIQASTISEFSGFSGACVSASTSCTFTAAAGNNAVNVGIAKRPKEAWVSLLPGTTIYTAAFDGSGNLIVATPTELRKLSPTGFSVWTKPIVTRAVATGPNDVIAVMTSTSVLLLDSLGNTTWTQTGPGECAFERCLAIDSDGSVAVRTNSTLMRLSPTGSVQFSINVTNGNIRGVGFSSGNVIFPGPSGGRMHTFAYDASGTSLGASALPISEKTNGFMSSTPTSISAVSSFNKTVYLGMNPTFVTQQVTENDPRIAASDTGYIVAYRNDAGGWSVVGPFGSMDRPFLEMFDIAISSADRTAIVGRWGSLTGNQAFVQTFDP